MISITSAIVASGLFLLALISVKAHKLTTGGGITGFLVAATIYAAAGLSGVFMLGAFFGLSVLASRYKRDTKFAGTTQDNAEARTSGQVLANAGTAAITGLLAILIPEYKSLFNLMLAGSLASATADTLASELGAAYSKRFYNCLTFKTDIKGLDGVISTEGLLFGAAGALIIALIATCSTPAVFLTNTLIITISGIIGNYADSVLGATLERKSILSNNWVNFLSTVIAAASVWLMLLLRF
ncbi:DUF92 domain-containing protein [Mucilaginibacter koreensis]